MLHEQTIVKRTHQSTDACKHAEERREDNGVLNRRLTGIVRYKLFIPLDIASQSSCNLGLKTVIAIIAITTSTPTKIAYSVVPWPCSSDSFAWILAHAFWDAVRVRSTTPPMRARTFLAPSLIEPHPDTFHSFSIPVSFSFENAIRLDLCPRQPHQTPPFMSSSNTGPNTKISIAGNMSTPVGTIIFTGALAMRSSRCALHARRA